MHLSCFLKTHLNKILTTILLLVLLTGCGSQNQTNTSSTSNPTASSHSTPTSISGSTLTSSQNDIFSMNKTGVSIDKANLHIDAHSGIQCPGHVTSGTPDKPGMYASDLPGYVTVLANNRLTYDSNEIQQMKDYLGGRSSEMPSTLQLVLGGPIGGTLPYHDGGQTIGHIDDCSISFEITNTGQNTIQIASAGVQLLKSTHKNSYQYRLIDQCTLVPMPGMPVGSPCIFFGGGPGTCDRYSAIVKLGSVAANTSFFGTPKGDDSSCNELTLNPKDTKKLDIYFYSPQNLIYSVMPQLTLNTSSGQNILSLPELTSTLAFAYDSQFVCYGLQGDAFVLENPSLVTSSYCI